VIGKEREKMSRLSFIGHYNVLADGKVLFEILSQLKNFGIGRVITKNEWIRRWPDQPSYLIVRKVEPVMDRWLSRGKVHADWIYRGKPLGVYTFEKEVDYSDWRLVHKHEEKQFCHCEKPFVERRIPSHVPLAPLERFLWQQKQRKEGKDPSQEPPMLPIESVMDEEHVMLKPFTKRSPELNPKPTGSVYDVNPEIYWDLYGKDLPVKIDFWREPEV